MGPRYAGAEYARPACSPPRVWAAILLLMIFAGGSRAAMAGSDRIAVSAEVFVASGRTRIEVVLAGPAAPTSFLLAHPDRLVVDLPDVNCQTEAGVAARRRTGLVAGLRCGSTETGRSRLVADLSAPALVSRTETNPGPVPGTTTLVFELVGTDRPAFDRAVARDLADLTLTTGSIGTTNSAARLPLIAIDAGHGGYDPGAIAPGGAAEKDITLAFAATLRDFLAARGRYRVLMIRDRDVFVPLEERVGRAREAGADLLVSIHADTISRPTVSGATVYTGAEHDALDDGMEGAVSVPSPAGAVPAILRDLTIRETRTFSDRAGGLLLTGLRSVAPVSPQPRRQAGFKLLRSPEVPAVLVELGYLSNRGDRGRMSSEAWRRRTAAGMASALDRFFGAKVAARAPLSP